MWKYLFQEHILERGLGYFINNLVENVIDFSLYR